jgi:hypothetical protein
MAYHADFTDILAARHHRRTTSSPFLLSSPTFILPFLTGVICITDNRFNRLYVRNPLLVASVIESKRRSEPKPVCRRQNRCRVYNRNVGSDLACYQFTRSKVERGDFRHCLSLYLCL